MSDIRTMPSMVERVARRQRPELEPEVEDRNATDAYGEVRAPRARGREALMIDVRKADGSCYGMMGHVNDIFKRVSSYQPHLWAWLGDAAYTDNPAEFCK